MELGDTIPDVTVQDESGPVPLRSLVGGWAAIYFYPKDDTSGCTREALDFTALARDFEAAGVQVVGISKDSVASHGKFTAKHELGVRLLSDESGAACEAFGVWVEKSMYGRKYMGIDRATFLFNAQGSLVEQWRKVKVPGHAQAVLQAAKTR
ncbi:peroxiredoxin [Sphingomonas lenta]|uniref:thioredoxin-dependent peroxiredoxin n=1 Tax=Sphingomonas lenta TaxID=1141887 RepID=A0A2A2SHP3_9SPHN|nr:peroxiredoxin [Sphingomonas lenta]